ncbi:MAG: DUF748 domain-containing protein, partial [Thermoguttaceae bacterium]|nr:DUF748 domain-containing protein [Thermoguttaceae bacterium]
TVTHVAEIGFERVDASLEDRRGRVGLFRGNGGSVLVRRQKDGAINLLGLLAVSKTNAPVRTAAPAPANGGTTNTSAFALGGWTLNLEEMQLDNDTLKVEDLVPSKPAIFLLDQLTLNLKGASTILNTPVTVNAAFRLNETGTVGVRGTAKVARVFSDLDVAVTNLELRAGMPYADRFVALGIVSGALTTAGKIRFQTNDTAAPLLTLTGGVRVTNFVTTDQVVFKEFVRWDDLTVSGIEAALAPNRFKIDEVRLVRPKASLLIGADRRPNLSLILRKDSAATNSAPATTPAGGTATHSLAGQFPVQLGTLALEQASLAFTDESVQPHVVVGIAEVSGTIKGLTSALNSAADVDLHGMVDE